MTDFEAPEKNSPPYAIAVVLNYNGWQDTLECLSSLEKLKYSNFEVVVVDNKSTNDSYEKIRNWINEKKSEKNPQFTLLSSLANLGYAGGNNIGIRHALERGASYVWILNNDTVVDPDSLSKLVFFAEDHPKTGLLCPALYSFDKPNEIQALGGRVRLFLGRGFHRLDENEELSYADGASLLVRAAMIKEVGLLDESYFLYWEDADWSFRAKAKGWGIACVKESKVWHKESKTFGKRSSFSDFHHARSGLIFLKKHGGWWSFVPVTLMLGGKILSRLLRRDFSGLKMVIRALSRG